MMHPLDAVRWLFRNEPSLTLSACGVIATLAAKWLGVQLDPAQIFTVVGLLLGVGVATRQVVRPDGRAKDEIRNAYQLGHIDHAQGRMVANIVPAAEEIARGRGEPPPYPPPAVTPVTTPVDTATWHTDDQPTPPGTT